MSHESRTIPTIPPESESRTVPGPNPFEAVPPISEVREVDTDVEPEPGPPKRFLEFAVPPKVEISTAIREAVMESGINHYSPAYLGKGSEKIVFSFDLPNPNVRGGSKPIKDRKGVPRNIVGKVDFFRAMPFLQAHSDAERTELREDLELSLLGQKERLAELRTFFGPRAVPVQRLSIQEVPVTRELMRHIVSDSIALRRLPESVPAVVSLERHLDLSEAQSLTTNYSEEVQKSHPRPEKQFEVLYHVGHDLLIGKQVEGLESGASQWAAALDMYPDLRYLAHALSKDPSLHRALAEAAQRLIAYTEATSIPLDLAGNENLVLLMEGQNWQLKFVDPFHFEDTSMTDLADVVGAIKTGQPISRELARGACLALHALRVTNALAILGGITDRLELPGLQDIPAEAWREVFRFAFRTQPNQEPMVIAA